MNNANKERTKRRENWKSEKQIGEKETNNKRGQERERVNKSERETETKEESRIEQKERKSEF